MKKGEQYLRNTTSFGTIDVVIKGEMMTIKDVAIEAGVSMATVSRVVNGKEGKCASKEVKMRVWAAVRKLGYVANSSAKSLKRTSTELTTAIIHVYHARQSTVMRNPYFDNLSEKVQQECVKQNVRIGEVLNVDQADYFIKNHGTASKNEGLLVLGRSDKISNELLSLLGKRIAFITLNQASIDYDQIFCDGVDATNLAMKHLFENGHSQIAYVGETNDEVRYVAYKENLIKNRINVPRQLFFNTPMTQKGGYIVATKLLAVAERPTAIFCANDVTAIGVLACLEENSIKVPDEISIISIDNIKELENVSPALTTVEIPLNELGGFGVKILLDKINGGHQIRINLILPCCLVKRESVKNIKKL